ncbi:hypothetical protein ACFFF5_21240 [Lederbergia wuyishanensis]|uniref:Uncharacterized protein n=1 Tax=Lederbergia wuyishanensis TaxID=1347903 RepID=A0ABU0D784_9BACI|nr:hypothetical protein [Lederbergia wuyishanensis]MCJ8008941.1 hypothetical protein [Lederbergia wuyishanensis]MDQ0344269.1 hypothetical protein [Lederbergia wuyishanensis]
MKIFYEEIDGMLNPKLMIIPFSAETQTHRVQVDVEASFEQMYSDDFHDDFKALTITQGEMLRDHFKETTFLIDIKLVEQSLLKQEIYPELIYEIDYFVMLIDDVEELLQMDVRRFYLE